MLDLAFTSFKELADKKKTVADADIEALLPWLDWAWDEVKRGA